MSFVDINITHLDYFDYYEPMTGLRYLKPLKPSEWLKEMWWNFE